MPPLKLILALVVLGIGMAGLAQVTGANGAQAHPLGTEVVVGYAEAGAGQPGHRTQLGLTVLDVRTGTREELEAGGLEAEGGVTPYYIDARIVNRGSTAVEPDVSLGFVDSGGDLVREPITLWQPDESFEPCPARAEGPLEPGESVESCSVVLVPEGVDVARVEFLSDNGPGEGGDFVYWAAE